VPSTSLVICSNLLQLPGLAQLRNQVWESFEVYAVRIFQLRGHLTRA
jgi:hypothetical protein